MGAKQVAQREKGGMIVTPWSQEDLDLMEFVLRLKLRAHPELKAALLDTKDATIIEDCTNRPQAALFWGAALQGDGAWKGDNHLGRLWMKLRDAPAVVTTSPTWCIVDTDNFGRDYPNERFVAIQIPSKEMAETMCAALVAKYSGGGCQRYYMVVEDTYKLQPGFEP